MSTLVPLGDVCGRLTGLFEGDSEEVESDALSFACEDDSGLGEPVLTGLGIPLLSALPSRLPFLDTGGLASCVNASCASRLSIIHGFFSFIDVGENGMASGSEELSVKAHICGEQTHVVFILEKKNPRL